MQDDKENVRKIELHLLNHTPYNFYINTEIVPGGILMHDGIVDIDDTAVFIVMRDFGQKVKVKMQTSATGWLRSRFTDEPYNNTCILEHVGAAFGMSCMRGYNTRRKPTKVTLEVTLA